VAFATVRGPRFTEWLTSLIPGAPTLLRRRQQGRVFLNALIAFILLAAVVYFFIVVPYRGQGALLPLGEPGEPVDVALLTEIRDILRAQGDSGRCRPARSLTF